MKKNMDEEALVSVIVPCYNVEQYVDRCIESILKQSYKNIEILAIDDGSNDNTGRILDDLARKDERINVYHFENGGLSAARNRGLDRMNGEYVICVDSDDFLDTEMIREMMESSLKNEADIVVCNHWMFYDEGKIEYGDVQVDDWLNMSSQEAIKKLFDGKSHFVAAWAKLYKVNLWGGLRYPEDIKFGEDMFLAHLLFDKAKCINYLGKPLYYYSQEGTSLVRSNFNKNKLQMLTAIEKWIDFCEKKYPEISQDAKEYYFIYIINMCSNLTMEFYSKEYEEYRTYIRKHGGIILKSRIDSIEKIKAIMIMLFSGKIYGKIRTKLLKI